MLNGNYLIGVMQGFESKPWATDPTKFNHKLFIVNQFEDRFGNIQSNYDALNINPEDVQRVQQIANSMNGKQVIVPVIYQAKKGGKDGAWLDSRLPKGGLIAELQEFLDSMAA